MIIYQIYPRSFRDTTGSGVGDLRGIIDGLPYLASLGCIDYIWISPFFLSPMKDFGYDVQDYYLVDPLFGTNETFVDLVSEARNRYGIQVMIDLVLAHTSASHVWFQESRSGKESSRSTWYVWADPKPDGTPPNNWLSVFGGPAWRWDSVRKQYYLAHFLPDQPALNWCNKEVLDAFTHIITFWAGHGVRGFRLDAYPFLFSDPDLRNNPPIKFPVGAELPAQPFLFQDRIHSGDLKPQLQSVAEHLRNISNSLESVTGEKVFYLGEISDRHTARAVTGPDMLHASYFFDLFSLPDFTAQSILETISVVLAQFPDGDFYWSLNNHDFTRHLSRFSIPEPHQKACAVLSLALFLSLPGGYCLYQGEELGLPGAELTYDKLVDPYDKLVWPEGQGRDRARTPMPWDHTHPTLGFSPAHPREAWLPIQECHREAAVSLQEPDNGSVLTWFKKISSFWKRAKEESQVWNVTVSLDPLHPSLLIILIQRDTDQYINFYNCSDTAIVLSPSADPSKDPLLSYRFTRTGREDSLQPYGWATVGAEGSVMERM